MGRLRSKTSSTILTVLFGSVLMSSMIWLVLSDVRLSGGFWPRDIGQRVSAAFGATTNSGQAETTRTSVAQNELTWLAVAVRLAALLVGSALISGVWAVLRPYHDSGKRARRGFESAFQSAIFLISRPWCLAGGWLIVWFIVTSITNTALSNFLLFATPLFVALIVASSLNGFWDSCVRSALDSETDLQVSQRYWKELLVVLLAAFGWEATSFWMNERLYAGLLVPHGDSAMYEEHLWNVWHGKGFRSYLDQGLFLGEHIQVIHLLLLPLHKIWPSYLMLELMASSSLAICAVPIFSIAKRHSGSSKAAMWLALAWLLFFPMHFLDIAIDLKTLRPSCYGLPFLFWGIDFSERRRLVFSSLCFLIALTTQEDFALVVGSIGAVLFFVSRNNGTASTAAEKRYTRWSLGLFLFSVAWVLLAVLVVIPAFRGGEAVHYSRYFGDLGNSPGDLFRTALRSPGKVLAQLFSLRTLYYGLVLTVPIALIPWRRPIYLLAGVATFCMLSLIQLSNSSESTDATGLSELPPVPFHHFHAPLLPVLFWAAAVGLGATHDVRWRAGRRQPPDTTSLPTPRSRAPALQRNALEAPASSENPVRQEPRNKDINSPRATYSNAVSNARLAFFCAACTAVSGSLMPIGATFWSNDSPFGWRNLYVPTERAAAFERLIASLPPDSRIASTDYVHTRLTHFDRSYDYSGYLRAVNDYKPGVPADTDYIVIDTGHRYSEIKSTEQVRELIDEPDSWKVIPNDSHGLFIVLRRVTESQTP